MNPDSKKRHLDHREIDDEFDDDLDDEFDDDLDLENIDLDGFINIAKGVIAGGANENPRQAKGKHEKGLRPPRKREMNGDPNDDFVAIDFETMSPELTSACAVGMVRVIDGMIAQRFYTLINPVRDDRTEKEMNFRIHGIRLSEAEKAPDFSEVFPLMREFIGGLKIVCHNRSVDINVIDRLMDYYGLSGIDTANNECTYRLTGLSLENCCKELHIDLPSHHDALCDAEACARVYLYYIGKPLIDQSAPSPHDKAAMRAREVSKKSRVRLDDSGIADKSTIFYRSTVVITGVFKAFPEREELAKRLQSLGAKVNAAISSATTIVIVGDGAGPKKLEKIIEMNKSGHSIKTIYEDELLSLLP